MTQEEKNKIKLAILTVLSMSDENETMTLNQINKFMNVYSADVFRMLEELQKEKWIHSYYQRGQTHYTLLIAD